MTQEMKLVQDAKAGNTAAFEQIVKKYQSLVCAITLSGTGQVDISEELAQETFLRAWKHLRELTDPGKFRPWLCTIARNMLNNYYRKKNTIPLDPADMAGISDQTASPSDRLITQEEHIMLEQTLMQIPAEYREPLVMYYRQEKSTREVAVALSLNESTVRTRLHRARQMLREEIAARLERTLGRTGPDKTFTKAVMVAVGGAVVGMSAGVNSASAAAHSVGTSASTGIKAAMSTLTAKIITAAAGVAITVGAVFTYKHLSETDKAPVQSSQRVTNQTEQDPAFVQDNIDTVSPEVVDTVANTIATPETQTADIPNNILRADESKTEPTSISQNADITETAEGGFAPKGILSGLITDKDTGEPVVGAEIVVFGAAIPYGTIVTDVNGFYCLKEIKHSSQYMIAIYSCDYVGKPDIDDNYTISIEKDKQTIAHFQLEKACMADLWVKDEQGSPIMDAEIQVVDLDTNRTTAPSRSHNIISFTDKDGYSLIGGHPASEAGYRIIIIHEEETGKRITTSEGYTYSERKLDFAPAQVVMNNTDPNIVPVFDVTLKKGRPVAGTVIYSNGVPASDLQIVSEPYWWSQTNLSGQRTDIAPDGSFVLSHVTPETYVISAYYPVKKSYKPVKTIDFSQNDEELSFTLAEPSPQSLLTIKGMVKVIQKASVGNLYIHVDAYNTTTNTHGSGTSIWSYDANGLAEFELNRLTEGNYRVIFQSEHFQTVVLEDIVPPVDDLYIEMEQRVKPEIVAFVVDKATGLPVTNMKARLIKTAIRSGSTYTVFEKWLERSHPQGKAVFTVTPGVYQVQIMADNYSLGVSEDIDTDDIKPVTIELTQGGTILGRVIDADGNPVAGAEISALSYAGGNRMANRNEFISDTKAVESDISGHFVLKNIPEGLETIKVVHKDFSPAFVRDIDVVEGQTSEDVIVTLEEEAVIEGYVFDNMGNVIVGVRIDFDQNRERVITHESTDFVVTDPNGYYRIGGLGGIPYFLARNRGSYTEGVASRTITPMCGEVTRVDFGGAGHTVIGTVVVDDAPAADMKLALRSDKFGRFLSYTKTDSDGNFMFAGIPQGKYNLRLIDGLNDTVLTNVEVVDTYVDLGVIVNSQEL